MPAISATIRHKDGKINISREGLDNLVMEFFDPDDGEANHSVEMTQIELEGFILTLQLIGNLPVR